MKQKTIIILGGGLSGLASGEILSKDFNIKIYESAPFIGGLAGNFEHNGKFIPMYYHHIVKSNKYTQYYLKKFANISPEELNWQKIKVAIGIKKKISIINSLAGLLSFKHLSFYEKFRFGLFGLYSIFLLNPKKIPQGLDARTWLEKYASVSVTKKIFHHLYARNKFNIPLKEISAKQFANRIYEKEVQDYFAFPKNGYQEMIDNLGKAIESNGGIIKIKSKITNVNLKEKYIMENNKKINYDLIINTIPFEEFIKISDKTLPTPFKDQLSKVKYCPAVGLVFSTKEFLKPNLYWINLFHERIQIIMQHSVLNDSYGEKISWCLRYGGSEEDLNLPEEEIKKAYLSDVKKYFPDAKINWAKVMRTKYAEPIYDINYHKYLPTHKTPVDGLYLTGIQLTYPRIRNMNVALKSGINVAKIILKDEMSKY